MNLNKTIIGMIHVQALPGTPNHKMSLSEISALAVAKAADLDFIRAEGFVFGHLADEGYIDSCAGELMRYRKMIEADKVKVFTDIKKKHSSHAITSDVDIVETAHAAEFFLSDGLIVTGSSTGKAVDLRELDALKDSVSKPVLIGSGITVDNITDYWDYANAFIIGSHFKENGFWVNPISNERLLVFMNKVEILRSKK